MLGVVYCSLAIFILHKKSYSSECREYCFSGCWNYSKHVRSVYFWKSPKLRSKLFSFAIMLLSWIDLGVGTVVHPLFTLESTTMLDSPKCLCIVAYKIATFFFSVNSACTIFIINIERYFAIIHQFVHRIHFTKQRFMFTWRFLWFLVVVWIVCRVYFPFVVEVITVSLGIIVIFYIEVPWFGMPCPKRKIFTDFELNYC